MTAASCRLLFSFLCFFAFATPASADIAAFNVAVRAGDYRAASAAAAQTWPTLDKAAPDIAIVAREFAWAAMLANDPRSAQTYASFLVNTPPATPPQGYLPVVGKVLNAWADFSVSSTRESRAALQGALNERAALHTTDLISLRAVEALYYDNWDKGRWKEAAAAASTGATILPDFGKGMQDLRYMFERAAIASAFADRPDGELARKMRTLAERALADVLVTTEPGLKDRMTRVYFDIAAWAEVAERKMQLDDKHFLPTLKSDAARRAFKLISPAPGDPALPECSITRADGAKAPKYPSAPSFSGWPGMATYRLKVDADGRFREIRLMGAAPNSDFAESAGKVIDDWRWTFRDGVRPPQCRMPDYYYVDFEFRLDG